MLGISNHADRDHLTAWVQGRRKKPKRIFVVRGEDRVCNEFAAHISAQIGVKATASYSGDIYDLAKNAFMAVGSRRHAESQAKVKRAFDVFDYFVAAGQRLAAVIRKNRGEPIKIWRNSLTRLMPFATDGIADAADASGSS